MSGYPYNGNPPQYPPPQNQIYPQIYNPANPTAPGQAGQPGQHGMPGQPGMPGQHGMPGYQMPGQNQQYPYQPSFGFQPYPGQQPAPGQPGHPASMSYPGITPTPTAPSAPGYNYPGAGYPTVTPQQAPSAVEWIPTTPQNAQALADRAVVAGYEGYDQSPLWVIRARFKGDLIPGKLAAKHRAAYVAWGGDENAVQEIEVCCARPERIRWVENRDGIVPPNAIPGGHTSSGEPLYIGRAREQGSLTPGKVHPSHKAMYLSFAGKEVPHKTYEILCSV